MDDSPRDPIEVDQKGKITVQYIDIDTGESLLSDETSAEVIGVQYIPKLMDIDNYELVETPENKDYYYDGNITYENPIIYGYNDSFNREVNIITDPNEKHFNMWIT